MLAFYLKTTISQKLQFAICEFDSFPLKTSLSWQYGSNGGALALE
jgi:hypothetical protein